MIRRTLIALAFFAALRPAAAEEPAPHVQWYSTWAQAKAEAARLDRPLLLISAAPQCRGISGIW